jgi:hypothetical protein
LEAGEIRPACPDIFSALDRIGNKARQAVVFVKT